MAEKALDNNGKKNEATPFAEYAKNGGPGRPKGSKNRFIELKQRFAKPENQAKVLNIFEEMLEGSKTDRREALKIAVNLLPREDKLTQEIAQLVINKTVVERGNNEAVLGICPKCNERIELRSED